MLSPLAQVVLFALFYALVIRSPTIDDELKNDPGLLQGEEYLHNHSRDYNIEFMQLQKSLAKYKVLPVPPHSQVLSDAKKKR